MLSGEFTSRMLSASSALHSAPRRRRIIGGAAVVIVFLGTFMGLEERIRDPNTGEAAAIGLIRAINSGESTYAAMHGYYDRLECLAGTRSCVPAVRSQRPFVSPDLATRRGEIRGYRFELHPGPAAVSAGASPQSPSAMTQYAVVAVPLGPRSRNYRAFCGDDRQTIYVTPDGAEPLVEAGRCVDTTRVLQ
jgi:hypothetical protein